ncbi:MAG: hypothetical protein O3B64_01795 [bacterium]|nr:hypothetical protein [bacterium]MDA1024355.1 hypothetical protein [bacterium]
MNKQIFTSLGVLALIVAGLMWIVGGNNPNLSELADLWWLPIPLGVILILIGMKKDKGEK